MLHRQGLAEPRGRLLVLAGPPQRLAQVVERINQRRVRPVVQAILTNVYKAFDRRGESEVYDVLARSVHGDLLQKTRTIGWIMPSR